MQLRWGEAGQNDTCQHGLMHENSVGGVSPSPESSPARLLESLAC
jgi:hypothetical protein